MIRVQTSVEIEQQPEEVFDYISDFENLPDWQMGVVESRVLTPGAARVGTIFEETVKFGFWKMRATCTVTELTRPSLMAFKATSTGPVDYEGAFRLQEAGSGTLVTLEGSMRLKGLWRLAEPLLGSDLRRETKEELQALRRNLANRAQRPAGR